MAELPGRPAERRLTRCLLLLLVLSLPGRGAGRPLAGQEVPEEGPARAGAHLELGGGLTLLHGEMMPFIGGAALVSLFPRVAVGGSGTVILREHRLAGDPIFPERALTFGYGGVLLDVGPRAGPAGTLITLRTLLGAGNTNLRDRGSGVRLTSRNVVVLEPALVFRKPAVRGLDFGASLAWRAVLGLGDIEDVDGSDLSALSLGIHLRVGPL